MTPLAAGAKPPAENAAAAPPTAMPNGGALGTSSHAPASGEVAPGVPNPGLAGLTATAPTTATAPADAPPSPQPVPTPASTQIAVRIAPLRLDADGVHRLTINLHPVDLGPVQVVAEIRGGEISVQLSGSTDAGNDALRNALDDLRRELQDSGFSNCSLDLRQDNPQQGQARQSFSSGGDNRGGTGSAAVSPPATNEPGPTDTAGNSRLDVRA